MDKRNTEEGWRNMDYAPRDGTPIIARFMEGIVTIAWWNTAQKNKSDPYWFCGIPEKFEATPCVQPREWMPLDVVG